MYGLVNKAIEQMVCTHFSPEMWEQIRTRAAIDYVTFVSMQPYPDDVTYRLVNAASHTLALDHQQILHAFGEYWTLYTAKEGYGDLIQMAGNNLQECLMNLDAMHARVGLIYPKLRPPSFRCSDLSPHGLKLHYYSERAGLAPMVLGLVHGLAKIYRTPIRIDLIQTRDSTHDHDIFQITFIEAAHEPQSDQPAT